MADDSLDFWVIYDHPRDEPEFFVVRKQSIAPGGAVVPASDAVAFRTLAEAQAAIPPGLFRIQGPGDDPDPVILEVYI